jgi:hypothetical protein
MALNTAYAAKYGSSVIAGLSNLNSSLNPEVQNESGIGTPFPQFVVITAQKPRIAFSSKAVAAALAITGSTGAKIDGTNGFQAVYAKLGDDGLPASGSVHRTYTAARGLLVPRRLNVNHRQSAVLDMEALLFSAAGTSHPLVIADNAALPSLVVNNVQHTLAGIAFGIAEAVTTFGCAQTLSIDFGSAAETLGCGSDLYDVHMQLPSVKPVITITGIDAAVFAGSGGVPAVGKPIDHANTAIYLRKYAENGIGFDAGDSGAHIKITCHGLAVVTQHNAQGTTRGEVTVQITGGWDGTNAPLQIDTAADLPS